MLSIYHASKHVREYKKGNALLPTSRFNDKNAAKNLKRAKHIATHEINAIEILEKYK